MDKECTKCKETLSFEAFRKEPRGKNGVRSCCKKCESKSQQERARLFKANFTGVFDLNLRKTCFSCKLKKHYSEFSCNGYTSDGLRSDCKPCANVRNKKNREKNIDKQKVNEAFKKTCCFCQKEKLSTEFYVDNGRLNGRSGCKKCLKNKEKEYYSHPSNKAKRLAKGGRRRAYENKAAIFGKSYDWLISLLYEEAKILEEVTGEKHHVDHITPLRGKTVCGLHVPWNLRVIKAVDNIRKGNRLLSV